MLSAGTVEKIRYFCLSYGRISQIMRAAAAFAAALLVLIAPHFGLWFLEAAALFIPVAMFFVFGCRLQYAAAASAVAILIWWAVPSWMLPAVGAAEWMLASSVWAWRRAGKCRGMERAAEFALAFAEFFAAAAMVCLVRVYVPGELWIISMILCGSALAGCARLFH